jgi:hypothetical protein
MDATSVDPGLGPFGNNGGQTDTQLISPTGPAAGLGLSGICAYTAVAVADTDQRGGKRISGANCDSGAVELNSLSDVALSGALGKVKFGSPVTFTLKITNNGPDPLLGATLGGANCAIGPLAVGASTSCAGSINWNGDSSISQTFTVSGDFIDPSGAGSLTLSALAPRLTSVSLRPPKITPTKSGATLGTKKIKGAAAIKYAGIDLASLSVPIQAPTGGNIVKGKCVKRKSGAKAKGKSCVLWRTLTTASVKNAKPSGTLYFTGRVKNKALKKGKYRLALTALSSDGGVGRAAGLDDHGAAVRELVDGSKLLALTDDRRARLNLNLLGLLAGFRDDRILRNSLALRRLVLQHVRREIDGGERCQEKRHREHDAEVEEVDQPVERVASAVLASARAG